LEERGREGEKVREGVSLRDVRCHVFV
jgi:hypothetical protein